MSHVRQVFITNIAHTFVSTRSLELIYKIEIYKNSTDTEISKLLADMYFTCNEKDLSNSKTNSE